MINQAEHATVSAFYFQLFRMATTVNDDSQNIVSCDFRTIGR